MAAPYKMPNGYFMFDPETILWTRRWVPVVSNPHSPHATRYRFMWHGRTYWVSGAGNISLTFLLEEEMDGLVKEGTWLEITPGEPLP